MRTRCPTFALIRVARLEMTPVAVLSASRIPGAALMPFIVDDEFHVFARERSLPPCALSFLMLAGFVIVILQNPLYELVMLPLWFGARVVVSRDYNAVNVVYLYLLTAARGVDGAAWGGASVSPNPIRVPARGRGMI